MHFSFAKPRLQKPEAGLSCPACGGEVRSMGRIPDALRFGGRRVESVLQGGFLWECFDCTLRFRHPTLDKARLNRMYSAIEVDTAWQTPADQRTDWTLARTCLER